MDKQQEEAVRSGREAQLWGVLVFFLLSCVAAELSLGVAVDVIVVVVAFGISRESSSRSTGE